MEIIFEVVIMILLRYPGALLRWIYFGGKKNYKELLNDSNPNTNTIISLCFIALLVVIFFILKSPVASASVSLVPTYTIIKTTITKKL
jgi:hypothetical protein